MPLLFLAGALTLLSFRTLAPDAFSGTRADSPWLSDTLAVLHGAGFLDLRPEPRFVGNLQTVRGLVSGEVDFPPSQQWVGRPAYVFPWVNMVLWGMGPALGLAAWGGFAAFALLGLRRLLWPRHKVPPLNAAWVVFAWVAFYFAWQGGQFAITLRYLLPIYGGLIIFGAWGLVWLWDRRTGEQGNRRTGEQANRRTGEQANRRTGEQGNRRTGEQANRRTAAPPTAQSPGVLACGGLWRADWVCSGDVGLGLRLYADLYSAALAGNGGAVVC